MPAHNGIRVVRSPIDGYGVVATRDFQPGETIADVDGVIWREEEDVDDRYSLALGDGLYMDMVDQTRWINHSCEPNTDVELDTDDQGTITARVVCIRMIRAGEEIAYDYAFPAALAEPCRCGSPHCRGLIVDPDEAHLVVPQRHTIGR